jgi:glycosyltransferase involved in cell wall biosynthesis
VQPFKILHTEWSMAWGGQEIRILQEAVAFLNQGHQISILAQPGSDLEKRAQEAGIKVFTMLLRNAFDPLAIVKLMRLFKKERFHVVNTHSSVDSWVASLAGKWAGVPVLVRTRHISVPAKTHSLNKVYSLPDVVITTGEQIRQTLIKGYHLPEDHVFSIPTGVDTDRFFPRPPDFTLKKELGLPEDALVITLVALLRSQKRHELVIAAAPAILEKYPQVRFLFVGEGPRRNRIEEELRRHRLEPFFLLTGHRNDIPEILSITDIGLISSEAEGVPQFLLQAMAMARPMVATRVGDIPGIIESGINGLLIPPEDPQALAEAVIRFLDDKACAAQMGQQARELIAGKYTAAQMAKQVYEVYLKVFKEKRPVT